MAFKPDDGQKRISFVSANTNGPWLTAAHSDAGRGPIIRPSFAPTPEQEAIRAAFPSGEDIAVTALAGSGKTTTLRMLAQDHPRTRMTYVAFNRALRNDQPVLTPLGWREIGTLSVGDSVFGADGLPHVVTKVHPRGEQSLFEVVFSDGTVVVADGDHLWTTQTLDYDKKFDRWVVRDTRQIRRLVTTTGRKIRVPHLSAPVQFPDRELPLDPYLLGVLLGDGSFRARAVLLSSAESELVNQVRAVLPDYHDINQLNGSDNAYSITGPRNGGRGRNVVTNALRDLELHGHGSQTKFIPKQYLFAGVSQRLALLQGLMDTDGCANGPISIFITISKQLVEDVRFLAQSLGGVVSVKTYPAGRDGNETWQEVYHVNVRLAVPLCPFRLPRKIQSWRPRTRDEQTPRKIVDVRPTSVGEATCISIDAPDHLFLTSGCVPTHNSIADEAQRRFPSNTVAKTMHSFAFGAVGRLYADRLNGARVPAWKAANILRIPERFEFGAFSLRSHQLARLALEAVQRFCHSDASEPSRVHIPKVTGLESPEARDALTRMLYPFVVAAWEDLSGQTGQLRFTHDVYLKLWAMGNPVLPGEVVLADEAQDFDPVIKQIVEAQNGQKVYVGDSNQQIYCQPPGTLVSMADGSSVKIEDIVVGDKVVAYKDRRVFINGRRVSSVTRVPYRRNLVRVDLPGGETSSYSDRHRCVVRFGNEMRGKHVVYLMRREGQFRVGRVPFAYETVGGLVGPVARAKAEGADGLWLLSQHDSASDAALAEALVSFDYGIPDACFAHHGDGPLDQERFWTAARERGTSRNLGGAIQALVAHGRRVDEPFWVPGQRVGLRTPLVLAACNLMDGMRMLPLASTVSADRLSERRAPLQCWVPATISYESFAGDLVSLEVEDCHTYFADGILTHNSWRGSVDALSSFQVAHRLPLQQSFRFGPRIAAEANRILEILESPLRIVGNVNKDSHLAVLDDPDCVLTRTNSEAIARLMSAQVAGVRAGLVGGTAQVEALAQAALDLTNDRKTTHHELIAFDNWAQVREYVLDDSDAKELQMLVKLVDRHGAEVLLDAVQRAVPEHSAHLVISTAHKAKGREWQRVTIAGDFQDPCDEETGEWNKSELRLAYVAITRGEDYLDCSNLGWLSHYASYSSSQDEERTFLIPADVPVREVVEVTPSATEQLIIDPEDATRLMFCRTPYSAELVAAQRSLPRSKFFSIYCGEEKVRVVLATQQALAVAERFSLSISDAARARVAELAG
jgi:hypothetical protein